MRDDGRDDAGNDAGAERDANLARLGFGSAAERAEDDVLGLALDGELGHRVRHLCIERKNSESGEIPIFGCNK